MTSKTEIGAIARQIFPKPKPNPGQIEAIVDACHAILNGKKHVVISAPTGTGKSLIATTIHKTLKRIKGKWRSTIITSTKGLQDQYTVEDSTMVDLRGKQNYMCPIQSGPYGSGNCRQKIAAGKCQKATMCPYIKKRTYWCEVAELRITNSSFQVSAPEELCMKDTNKADLIVIDECHEIDDLIIEHTSISMNIEDLSPCRKYGGDKLIESAFNFINYFRSFKVGETFDSSNDLIELIDRVRENVDTLSSMLEDLYSDSSRKDLEHIGDILESLMEYNDASTLFESGSMKSGSKWIVHEMAPGKIVIKPVYAWQVANHSIFRKSDFFIHTSATICGFDQYLANLGIDKNETCIIEVANSIPVENRKVLVIPTQKVSSNFDIDKLARDVDKLIGVNKGLNGIVHTVSFKLANDIKERSKYQSKMLVSGDRKEILDFLSYGDGRIVLSPSIEKGYDFRGDLSRFQIIAKVPYLFLGDPLIALNSRCRGDWYARKTILRLVQACGRSVRGVDDWASTYIIDSNFLRLLTDNYEIFPEWFVESIDIVS